MVLALVVPVVLRVGIFVRHEREMMIKCVTVGGVG